jgi:hypothetical protein
VPEGQWERPVLLELQAGPEAPRLRVLRWPALIQQGVQLRQEAELPLPALRLELEGGQ